MEQQWQLKTHGNLSLFEQDQMPAEERAWWMRRIQKHHKDQEEANRKNQPRASRMPRMPRR